MYACTVRFVLEPYSQWEAEHMTEAALHFLKQREGFVDLVVLGEYETGDYEWVVVWDSKTAALRVREAWCEEFKNLIGDYGVLNEPYIEFYHIIHPVSNSQSNG